MKEIRKVCHICWGTRRAGVVGSLPKTKDENRKEFIRSRCQRQIAGHTDERSPCEP